MAAPRLMILGLFRRRLLPAGGAVRQDAWRLALRELCVVLAPGVLASEALADLDEPDTSALVTAEAARPDAVALVMLTACSTERLEPFLRTHRGLPFVLLAPQPAAPWDSAYGLSEHLAGSGQVGAAMVASLLARHGVRFIAHVPGPTLEATPALTGLLEAVATAGRLRRLRLLRIEGPHVGYSHMELPKGWSSGEWAMKLDDARVSEFFSIAARPGKPASLAVSRLPGFDAKDESLRQEVEFAGAMLRRCRDHDIDAVTINSARIHALTRDGPRTVLGKVALSILGAEGIACADTGDVLAAILLFIGKRVADAAVYCEVNATAGEDQWHCSTTGEIDLAWMKQPRAASAALLLGADLTPNAWTVKANVGAGAATLIGIASVSSTEPAPRLRLTACEGEALPFQDLQLPRGAFAFRVPTGAAEARFARWLESGATHHACLVDGHVARALGLVAQLAGAEIWSL